MTSAAMEEGDAPTAPDPEPADDKTTLVKMATLWIKIDGLMERSKELFQKWAAQMEGSKSTPSNGGAVESRADGGSSVNRITINLGGSTLIVVIMLASIIGACGVVMGIDIAERSIEERRFEDLQRQYRMTELKLDDWTVVAHRSGLVLPGDYARGPQGNLDAVSFTPQQERK